MSSKESEAEEISYRPQTTFHCDGTFGATHRPAALTRLAPPSCRSVKSPPEVAGVNIGTTSR